MKLLFILLLVSQGFSDSSSQLGHSGAWKEERGEQVTIQGNVLSSREYAHEPGQDRGISLNVATESGEIQVLLGPRWVRFHNDLKFTQGEPVTIVGLKISFQPRQKILAEKVIRRNQKVILRENAKEKQ